MRRRRSIAVTMLGAALVMFGERVGGEEIRRGMVVEGVRCGGAAGLSYTVYLPAGYKAERAWPILYVFDARARGRVAAERFIAGAERYGWIVASSEQSASDGPLEPNVAALRAMWTDTHTRFTIDDRRVYAAGYSGTVRFACLMADAAPGSIAGIIGAAGGFAKERPPRKDTSFLFFGTAGTRDFNYDEMTELDAQLAALGLPHRIEVFAGQHQWMPEDLATRAIGWMELQAAKSGRREAAPAWLDPIWNQDLEAARALAAAAKPYEAWHAYAALAADFTGLRDVAAVAQKAAELGGSAAVRRERERREARRKADLAHLRHAQAVLERGPGDEPAAARRAVAAMGIAELQRKSALGAADPDESAAADRLLNGLLAQTAFYLPRQALQRKDYNRAIFDLEIAGEIRPADPDVWYQLAAVYARKGSTRHVLELLDRALKAGWSDRSALAADPDFEELRKSEEFRRWWAALPAPGKPP
jgi:predicted esterase